MALCIFRRQNKRNETAVMSLLVMFFGFWSCLVYFENCEIFEIKVRDEFTLKMSFYTYIYIFTASVVKRARMLINSIGSSWEGFGWTIGTILVRTRDLLR